MRKNERLLFAINDLDEDVLSRAADKSNKRTVLWMKWGTLAACFTLVICAAVGIVREILPPTAHSEEPPHDEDATAIDTVTIHYVADGKLQSERMELSLDPVTIFAQWKVKNGIGEEVLIVGCRIESDGQVTEHDNGTVSYIPGKHHYLYVTITAELENYLNGDNRELLLFSLEKTMTGYSSIDFDEYHLIVGETEQ